MKKISILLLTALSCSAAFLSCGFQNLQAPKEVVVRTDATYEFSVMNFDSEKEGSKLKISNYFDFGKTLEEKSAESADSSNMKVYKYNNGSQYQQYLIHMPLKEVEFDFAESFKNMDFSKAVQSVNIDKEVKIPEVDGLDDKQPVDLTNIMKALNNAVIFTGKTDTNKQTVTFQGSPVPFTSISYTSGELVITAVEPLNGEMYLYNGDTPLGSGSFSNRVARISLAGKTLDSTNTKIQYTGDYPNKNFTARIDENSIINTAEGINISVPAANQPTANVSFDVNIDQKLTNVTIQKGKMEIEIIPPNTWTTGIISGYTVDVGGVLSPGVTITDTDNPDDDPNGGTDGNLKGQSISAGKITASAKVFLDLTGGKTIVFANKPQVHVSTAIETIDAEVIMDEGFSTTINKTTDPTDLKAYVDKITWKNTEPGFRVTARNNLPSGNNMTLNLASTELCVPSANATILSGIDPADPDYEQTFDFDRDNPYLTNFLTNPTITVTGSLTPQAGNTANTIKVKNVSPGETYNIYVHVEPVFEWEEAEVKTTNFQSNMKNAINTGMNRNTLFASLGEQFAEKMKIREIPSYLFINIPDALMEDNHLEGTIRAFYGETNPNPDPSDPNDPKYTDIDPADKKETYVIGAEGTPAVIPNTSSVVPDFEINDQGEATHIFGAKDFDFADAMNMYSQAGTLCLDYAIELTGGTSSGTMHITPDQLDQGKSSIKMDVVMILTMDFNLQDTISIDMLKLAKKSDSDLLGRSEASSNETIEKFLSVVQTATLNIDDFKLPMTGDVSLAVDMYKNGNKVEKPVGSGETYSLEVNPLTLIQTYPLQPDVKFVIGKQGQTSNFGILRTMPISGKIRLRIEADGDIPVYSNKD